MEIQVKINRMRAQADFLARHMDLLEELSYDSQWKALEEELAPLELDYSLVTQACFETLTYVTVYCSYELDLTVEGPNARQVMRTLTKAIGGRFEKSASGSSFRLSQRCGDLYLLIGTNREAVCTPKVVGQKEIVRPAVEAQPETIEVVDEIEWDCGNLLEADNDAEVTA